jgi:hypothetical protein
VDIIDIIDAMSMSRDGDCISYLDIETGEVQHHFPDLDGPLDDEFDASSEEPDDDKEELPPGPFITLYRQNPDRFLEIPHIESREEYERMIEFAASLDEEDIAEKMNLALRGKGAFRRFRDVIDEYPDIQERWFAEKYEYYAQVVVDWLEEEEIKPIYQLPTFQTPPITQAKTKTSHISLLHVLLLGSPSVTSSPTEQEISRHFLVAKESEARSRFVALARELAEMKGLGWRKRFVQGTNRFEVGDITLEYQGKSVMVRVRVPNEVCKALMPT